VLKVLHTNLKRALGLNRDELDVSTESGRELMQRLLGMKHLGDVCEEESKDMDDLVCYTWHRDTDMEGAAVNATPKRFSSRFSILEDLEVATAANTADMAEMV